MELIAGENDKGRRLDRVLRKALPDKPLPLIHRLLRQGHVLVNGKPAKAQTKIEAGSKIKIEKILYGDPDTKGQVRAGAAEQGHRATVPSNMILYEGQGLLILNKPAGLIVHGYDSLDEMVRTYLLGKIEPSLSFKSGPLHRLDKETSGVIVFSTGIEGAQVFTSLMRERKVKKTYLAIVEGCVKNEEIWEDPLFRDKKKKKTVVSSDGKPAITKISPLDYNAKENGGISLVKAEILTGISHQIRAQAAFHGFPLLGDVKYGSKCGAKGDFYLHAWKLEFLDHKITAPPPLHPSRLDLLTKNLK